MKTLQVIMALVLFGGSGWMPKASAQSTALDRIEDQLLISTNPQVWDYAGEFVAVSGPWKFISSWASDVDGLTEAGKVTVYHRTPNGYQWYQELVSDDPSFAEVFSSTGIDADGDLLVIAANQYPTAATRTGKAHIFRFNGTQWEREATLEPGVPPGPPYLDFARQVKVRGNSVFISAPGLGAPLANGNQSWIGGFYEYQYQQGAWNLTQTWTGTDDFSTLGWVLATDGETLALVGIPGAFDIHMFERNANSGQWELTQVIAESMDTASDQELAIEIEGDLMAMGSDNLDISSPGKVQLYRRQAGVWVRDQVIQPIPFNGHVDGFGKSLDLRGNRLIVGASQEATPYGSHTPGAAYIYEYDGQNNWREVFRLRATDDGANSAFGTSVALGEDMAIVGDRIRNLRVAREGAAFAFDLPFGAAICGGADNSTGASAWLEVVGSRIIDSGLLKLRTGQVPPGQTAMFLAAQTSATINQPGGSQGVLCLGGSVMRLNQIGQFGAVNAQGQFELILDPTSNAALPPIQAGQTWIFQAWYRDNNPAPTSNFSAAVSVQFE